MTTQIDMHKELESLKEYLKNDESTNVYVKNLVEGRLENLKKAINSSKQI